MVTDRIVGISAGKARRLGRLIDSHTRRTFILPIDHALISGRIPGIDDIEPFVVMASRAGVDAMMLRWGEAKRVASILPREMGLIVRIAGATERGPDVNVDVLTNSVASAAAIGADAVCLCFRLGSPGEDALLRDVGRVAEECETAGLVFLCEGFALDEGGQVTNDPKLSAWSARVAQELGADMVKVVNPGTAASMRSVKAMCQVPVVVAGGDATSPLEVLGAIDAALEGGADGVAVGRNVISSPDPERLMTVLAGFVHSRTTLADARTQLANVEPAKSEPVDADLSQSRA